jgi:hypothetical protein
MSQWKEGVSMSKESLEWLNANTLIGFTSKRGTAWHYRADRQSKEPNHYPGSVPVIFTTIFASDTSGT